MTALRAILIAGPTASGKSAWAVRLAVRHHGVVINADSMQVYRDLSVLTARPGPAELAAAPHALYGHVGGDEPYSVGRWIVDAAGAIAACQREGRLPIVVGGAGLYFKALLEGLSPIPAIPPSIREHWRAEARRLGPAALHAVLAARDWKTAAQLRPSDPQRLTRALEVLDATGRPLAEWQRDKGKPVIEERDVLRFVVSLDRDELVARADARFDAMMAAGALAEVRALAAKGYSDDVPLMRALGVRPLIAAAQGRIALAAAVAEAKIETRRYIKRQQTWLRRNMITWNGINSQFMERNLLDNFTLKQS